MKFLLLLMLTRYAAECDDTSNYYVVEVPEEELATEDPETTSVPETTTTSERAKRPFQVYWNVPTMQCKSKKVLFELEEFGIIQNKDDSFRGEHVAILYDPGLFPALLKNESSGELKFRNGGVPQEGNMTLHLDAFKATLEQSIPDQDFSGVGIIDFESWRPVFRQNFGVLVPYKDVSYEIERKLHWWWTDDWIQTEAKQRFEAAARAFMQTTLSVAKQLRPRALWGYYGFPYCFNMGTNNKVERCADNVDKENDGTYWLWSESTALFPSVYSSSELTTAQLTALIRGRVREARRVRRKATPVLPYFWFRYREGGYMSEVDLYAALKTFYTSNANGFIIWGSSNDVNTLDKCQNLLKYVQTTLGPAIAKYTKANTREEDELPSTTENIEIDTEINEIITDTFLIENFASTSHKVNATVNNTTVVNTRFIPIDPDFPWEPPANYSQEISHYVEEELTKKDGYNESKFVNEFSNANSSLLMEILLSSILHNLIDSEKNNMSENAMTSNNAVSILQSTFNTVGTTTDTQASDVNILTSTSKYSFTESLSTSNVVTKNPLDLNKENVKIELRNDSTISSNENLTTTEIIKETLFTATENNIYTDIATNSYRDLTSQPLEELNVFDSIVFNPHDFVIGTADSTTEILTLPPNATTIFDTTNIFNDQKTITANNGLVSSSTDTNDLEINTITETGEFNTETIAEYITNRSDVMKQYKKENIEVIDELIAYNSTDLVTAENSEPEQVVIYIS